MKKIITVVLAAILCMGLAVMSFAAVSEAIDNGDFEENIGAAYANDGAVILELSDKVYTEGAHSLKMSGRTNQWGAAAWDVAGYMAEKGAGKYYVTLYVTGNFEGSIRATLHTNHASGADVYRNIAVMTPFNPDGWTKVGVDENGNALALGAENWEIDYSEWDKEIAGDVTSACLYFWIEGDDFGDVYIDAINFWHESDTPVEYTLSASPAVPSAAGNEGDVSVVLEDDTTEEEDDTTAAPASTTEEKADSAADTTGKASDDKGFNWIPVVIIAAAVIVVAVVAAIIVKKNKK